jgi:hypothetical protein
MEVPFPLVLTVPAWSAYKPRRRSALPCAIRSLSAVLTGSRFRKARASCIEA